MCQNCILHTMNMISLCLRSLKGKKSANLWSVCCDRVENIDKHKEEGDKEGHAARDHVHRDQEGDPGHYHK